MIVFENRGEIDIAALTTFGVSVKMGDNPIGFFGTGLKYAIAVLLRAGCRITVFSGEDELRFSTHRANVRGKDFEFVDMSTNNGAASSVGFTTELGKSWKLWMAYRELYCNARDEGGEVYAAANASGAVDPRRDMTQIRVEGSDFAEIHADAGQYFIEEAPDLVVNDVGIYRRPSTGLFYRGIRVLTLPKPARFTYSLLNRIDLTEDRTMAHPFMAEYYLRRALTKCSDPEILEAALTATADDYERDFNYQHEASERPSQEFMDAVGRLNEAASGRVAPQAVSLWATHHPTVFNPLPAALTASEADTLDRVVSKATRIWDDLYPVEAVCSIPDGASSFYANDTIYVAETLLDDESALLRTVLMQHLQGRSTDDTCIDREEMLLDALVTAAESADALRGEQV